MRVFVFLIAGLAIVQGLWLTASDALLAWPGRQNSVALAEWAATIGLVRGDLWGEAARRGAAALPADPHAITPTEIAQRAAARSDARRALALAPLRSDLWLLLADRSDADATDPAAAEAALEMAYLTGAGKVEDLPGRLLAAARSPSLTQGDLKDLVELDIRHVLRTEPRLTPALIRAYQEAIPANRSFFEETARTIDPAFHFPPL